MRAVIVAAQHAAHQQTFGGAFAAGLRRHGWEVEISTIYKPADMVVFWGVRKQDCIMAQRRHGEVCILERGYVGDRFAWTSVSFGGGLNGRGEFRGPLDDASRWRRHFSGLMQPWRRQDGYALIMGQVLNDMSMSGLRPKDIWSKAAADLAALGTDVRFKPHPKDRRQTHLPGVNGASGDLGAALAGASLVVTINSNSGVDAVLAGVPTVTLDAGAMAWPVTSHRIGDVLMPDRERWAHALAWKQWLPEEMASGECWEAVGCPGFGSPPTMTTSHAPQSPSPTRLDT